MSAVGKRRPCIGCGVRPVKGLRYCRICKARLAVGLPCDLETYPTFREGRRAVAPEPDDPVFGTGLAVYRGRGLRAMQAGR